MSGEENRRESDREIVIVRRSQDEDEGHHGGVWKIAYADFMTAMMAFFLVMWLVNAASEETKSAVASYFNPIQLMDEKPADRSIRDEGEASEGLTDQPAADTQGQGTTDAANEERGRDEIATAGEQTRYSEADYFEDPYAVLAEIVLEDGREANISSAGEGGAQISGPGTGAAGGEAYRDPFDPDFWQQQTGAEATIDPVTPLDATLEASEAEVIAEIAALSPAVEPPAPVEEAELAVLPEPEPEPEAADPDALLAADAERLRADLTEALAGIDARLADGLDVSAAEGGLLISITDQLDYGMFNIGSAVPSRDLVLAMEEIGELLANREGALVIRGHTDARPFQGEGNDNWRLSTDRAHSAYYMLVRAGLAEERVVQVTGFADRRLKIADDPYSDLNRRIEILIQPEGDG